MIRLFPLFLVPLFLAVGACAAAPAGSGTAQPLSITYATSPCFGTCPVYSVTVDETGKGTFTGTRFTAASGVHAFAVSRDQFDAFAKALAPLRPKGEALYEHGSDLCPNAATDQTSVDVRWTQRGKVDRLYYYFGCDMDDRTKRQRLRSAIDALAIGKLIDPR